MYHYLFTNDLRISSLDSSLQEAAYKIKTNTVPSASEDKSLNNNINTLGFYFNLTQSSNCTKIATSGDIRKVVLNFIKKFQFPNPRTFEAYDNSNDDGIKLAPMRLILKLLYLMSMNDGNTAHLSKFEIENFIFFNEKATKTFNPDLVELYSMIKEYRKTNSLPSSIEVNFDKKSWKQSDRQLREMIKVLTWSGCVTETHDGDIKIDHSSLSEQNKADIFEIVNFTDNWSGKFPYEQEDKLHIKSSYQEYMDVKIHENINGFQNTENIFISKDSIFLSTEWFKQEAEKHQQVDIEANELYEKFQSKYSKEVLQNLPDSELLGYIFLGVNDTSLCHALEFDGQYGQFGSISGGTAYKYNLFFNKTDKVWKTSFGDGGQRTISEDEALKIGKEIRDALIIGLEIIENKSDIQSINDYTELLSEIETKIPQYIRKMWFLKYYHMMFPHILPNFYNESWQKHILCNLNIFPSDDQFIRMGQIMCFINKCEISSIVFATIIFEYLGMPKTFYRIGTGDNGSCLDDWKNNNYIAIGWNELGDLNEIYKEESDSKTLIINELKGTYNADARTASRKCNEIDKFYKAVANDTYIVAMSGQSILAIGELTGSYYYDDSKDYAHCKQVKWLKFFDEKTKLPVSEGNLTTFVQLSKSENICYLYELLRGKKVKTEDETVEEKIINPINYDTDFKSEFHHNRILFGAPGTGKSYTLNNEKDELLKNSGSFERVTFHPDYSYANFVGTYKPVPFKDGDGRDSITYEYVPGPFMRTYVKALQSSRNENPQPHLLMIEEINRANVAAVFGDVFQLLDRCESGFSEYSIQASEDIKNYLAKEEVLGGKPNDYDSICIPNNMFIWATMNSADQGVFPMDTAFKRRWEFTYLGIDDSEDGISDKRVELGKGEHKRVVSWNKLRKHINAELLTYKVNEDKLLGPYFISKKILGNQEVIDTDTFISVFKNKVIMYLFDDAAKQKRLTLFNGCEDSSKNQYSKICKEFDEKGVNIFCESISSHFLPQQDEKGDE